MSSTDPRTGMQELGRDECLALLARRQHGVGRIAVIDDRRPQIFPVNFVLVDERVLFCTDEGTKLDAAVRRKPVAFEIDDASTEHRSGWSVVIAGTACHVTDEATTMLLGSLGLQPFAAGLKRHWVVIEPDLITGRRVPTIERWFR